MFQKLELILRRLFGLPISPQRFFLLTAGVLGFFLVFIAPPFQAPDEHTHFYKEVYLSRGHIMAHRQTFRVGADLPAKYQNTVNHYTYMYLDSEKKLDTKILKHDLKHPIKDSRPKATAFENTAQYPPLSYVPQSIAVFISHIFTGSVLWQMYAARIGTLITWLVLMFFAIKNIPFAKWGLVALALTPLSVFLSISCSNDAIIFGLSALLIAFTLSSITKKEQFTKHEFIPIALTAAALGLCKPPYFMISALALAIPIKRFGSLKNYIKTMAILFGITLLVAVIWELMVKHIIINFYPGSDTAEQTKFIIHHPVSTSIMILKTLLIYPIGDDMILQLVGLKAWMAAQTPFWLIMLDYVVITLAVLYTPLKQKLQFTIEWPARVLSGLLIVGGVLSVSLLLYITYTPVGLGSIVGLQGRYFIPFSYLVIGLIGGSQVSRLQLSKPAFRTLQLVIVAIAVTTLPLTISRYY